jgi:hypothetical protein
MAHEARGAEIQGVAGVLKIFRRLFNRDDDGADALAHEVAGNL